MMPPPLPLSGRGPARGAPPHPAFSPFARAHHEPVRHVTIGDVAASRHPLRLETVLGSCVSVCLFDPGTQTGGMNHILVPSSRSDCLCAARCGVQAMELLINAMMNLGADRRRFVAKAFGGGSVLPGFPAPTVGDLNARFVRQFLAAEGIPLLAERMGGNKAVRVVFHPHTGRAFVRSVEGVRLPALVREETTYFNLAATERFPAEEPVIF